MSGPVGRGLVKGGPISGNVKKTVPLSSSYLPPVRIRLSIGLQISEAVWEWCWGWFRVHCKIGLNADALLV